MNWMWHTLSYLWDRDCLKGEKINFILIQGPRVHIYLCTYLFDFFQINIPKIRVYYKTQTTWHKVIYLLISWMTIGSKYYLSKSCLERLLISTWFNFLYWPKVSFSSQRFNSPLPYTRFPDVKCSLRNM